MLLGWNLISRICAKISYFLSENHFYWYENFSQQQNLQPANCSESSSLELEARCQGLKHAPISDCVKVEQMLASLHQSLSVVAVNEPIAVVRMRKLKNSSWRAVWNATNCIGLLIKIDFSFELNVFERSHITASLIGIVANIVDLVPVLVISTSLRMRMSVDADEELVAVIAWQKLEFDASGWWTTSIPWWWWRRWWQRSYWWIGSYRWSRSDRVFGFIRIAKSVFVPNALSNKPIE